MKKIELNDNDISLLNFCQDVPRTTRMIAEHLGIAVKNVLVRLPRLEEEGLIEVRRTGKGKHTFIRTKGFSKVQEYTIELLKAIKKKPLSENELTNVLSVDPVPEKNYDKYLALTTLPYKFPTLVERKYFLTPEGEKFLQEHKNDKTKN